MRRTVLSAAAVACVAVLASAVPAFAGGADSSPTPRPATEAPSARPSAPGSAEPSAVPSRVPGRAATPVPSVAPGEGRRQVGVVPSGAPDTGVATDSGNSDGMLIGGSSAGALAVGGAAVFLVRRRRATGA
ncbi:sortase-dependent protein [Streptomyces seoulensis]|uniref:sortase-dependent protein n=1 Tax=Streptomyces seoulensis TaxID=73044 RepID=UPI0033BD929A